MLHGKALNRGIRFPDELWERIEEAAGAQGLRPSEFVRDAARKCLDGHESKFEKDWAKVAETWATILKESKTTPVELSRLVSRGIERAKKNADD
jgi:metal-responsive CopG/Arc/MetJ family transcriptional regulator